MNKLEDFTHDINGKVLAFDGNDSIKGIKQPLPLTKEHIEEYIKCKNDIFYFAERYHHILSLDLGMIKIKLRDYQKEIVEQFQENRFNIILSARQSGKCCVGDTKIKIRNKKTGEIREITLEEFYNMSKKSSSDINKDVGKVATLIDNQQ